MGLFPRRRARREPQPPAPPPLSFDELRAASLSYLDRIGPEKAFLEAIVLAREILEENPALFGALLANGIRDPGTLEHAARAAVHEYEKLKMDFHARPPKEAAQIPARIFAAIAYEQPFFDGNKRTGLLGGSIVATMLGFDIRDSNYAAIEEEVRLLSARNAPVEDVADWFLEKVLILPTEEGYR